MGARLRIVPREPGTVRGAGRSRRPQGQPLERGFTLDVAEDTHGELFELTVEKGAPLSILAVDVRPEDRHLLLLVKFLGVAGTSKQKFLCGHDERHWFVAAVPEASAARDVASAKEALKPPVVRAAQARLALDAREKNGRKNRAYVRQGEWFFVPAPDVKVSEALVLGNEPLQRGRGKPHLAEELYRWGGRDVYVADRYPRPLSEGAYHALLTRRPGLKNLGWRRMRLAPQVVVRGKISHPDHKTIVLRGWHRVLPNTEHEAAAMRNVVFLD
ncbi:MAG: hypothetical protein HY815_30720 [Candidatus Riflebacteria bacterium]|nr:hypothetical protein [Candidatus Riflebacteria bacterium]